MYLRVPQRTSIVSTDDAACERSCPAIGARPLRDGAGRRMAVLRCHPGPMRQAGDECSSNEPADKAAGH